jgi:hypothetical protein
MTASTPVLSDYKSSYSEKVSACYADDCISVIYMLLLSSYTKEEEVKLKEYAHSGIPGMFIAQRRIVLKSRSKEIIDRLYEIESERDRLTNIDDLHNRCQQIIETLHQLGFVS